MQLRTTGIILRDLKIEEDRLLTVLTEGYGVLFAYANGANRTRSKLAASTELLCYSDMVLFKNRDRHTVDKADSKRIFFGIRGDLEKLALASYLAELTIELAPHGEEAGAYLRLLLNTLHLLEAAGRPAAQLKALYELRLLTLSGYMPGLVACRECGRYEAPGMRFFPRHGELVCGDCIVSEGVEGIDKTGGIPVGPGVLQAMRHIVYSEPEKLFAFSLKADGLKKLGKLAEDYLKYQVEKTFPTLEFYHGLTGYQ